MGRNGDRLTTEVGGAKAKNEANAPLAQFVSGVGVCPSYPPWGVEESYTMLLNGSRLKGRSSSELSACLGSELQNIHSAVPKRNF